MKRRRGFTLVELLVVASILAVLATTTAFALMGIMDSARRERTRSQISRIHQVLMTHYETYPTKRLRLNIPAIRASVSNQPNLFRRQLSQARLEGMWRLIRHDLPERYTDIIDDNEPDSFLLVDSTLRTIYQSQIPQSAINHENFALHQQAECLYLIIANSQFGGRSALDFFQDTEIQDTDGDGMLEIVDAWGQPIYWLRWAPGISLEGAENTGADYTAVQPADPVAAHSPLDPLRLRPEAFALHPFVYSAGPDSEYEIYANADDTSFRYSQVANSSATSLIPMIPNFTPPPQAPDMLPNLPYIIVDGQHMMGQPFDRDQDGNFTHADNITNHLTGVN